MGKRHRFSIRRAVKYQFPVSAAVIVSSLVPLLAVAGCASGQNPVSRPFMAVGLGPPVPPAKEFVEKSRPENMSYISIEAGESKKPERKSPKTMEQVQGTERDMDAAIARNAERGEAAAREGQKSSGDQ